MIDQPRGRGRIKKYPIPNKIFLAATICFFRSEDAGHGRESGIAQLFPEDAVELDLVLSRVFSLLIYDKGWVVESPITDRLVKPLERLGVDDFDQDFLPVFSGYLLDPSREKEVILLQIFRVIVQNAPILFFLQTHLVRDKLTGGSSVE